METILIEIEQLNIGMTSLLRGQNAFKKKNRYNNSKNYEKTIII